jgi:hypothetical protein
VKRTIITVATAATGLVLALGLATPATAQSLGTPDSAPPTPAQLAELGRYLAGDTNTTSLKPDLAPSAPIPNATTSSVKVVTVTAGKRLIHKRGTSQLWTSNSLEWYWNSSKITSSVGWQDVGFTFPNTASKGGIKRTLVSNSDHNWRGTVTVGIGTPTPWGDVDFYKTSVTDNYQLKRGGSYIVN